MRQLAATFGGVALALGAAGCAGSHSTSPPTRPQLSIDSPRAQLIALARKSNPRIFSLFPATPGHAACAIPEGGVHRPREAVLPGTCTTRVYREKGHEPAVVVAFTETWGGFPHCPPGVFCGDASPLQRHGWQVVEGQPEMTPTSPLHIVATRNLGATAPQDYK